MSERFTRLFSLPENLYAQNAPVVIAAGALLKDNQTGKVLGQLKLRSISAKRIKAVTVRILMQDVAGKRLGEPVEHQYLDIDVARDVEFAQKIPVVLPDNTARGMEVSVIGVVFYDNSTWTAGEEKWEPLSVPTRLSDALRDYELIREYKLAYGSSCEYLPSEQRGLWYCSCGALNHDHEDTCHVCKQKLTALLAADFDVLRKKRDARLAEQAAQRAEQAKREAAAKARLRKKIKSGLIIAALVLIIGAVAAFILTQPMRDMEKAQELANKGDYMAAIALLDEIGKADMTREARESCIKRMRNQIENAIAGGYLSYALELMKEYTILDTTKYLEEVQKICKHQHLDDLEKVDATCTVNGYDRKICQFCAYVKETTLPAHGHSFTSNVTKKPTCTKSGLKDETCSVCGEVVKDIVLKASGHKYNAQIITPATCVSQGKTKYACERCGDSYTETVGLKAHSFAIVGCDKPLTCKGCGQTSGGVAGHLISNGLCTRCYKDVSVYRITGTVSQGTNTHYNIKLPKGTYYVSVATGIKEWSAKLIDPASIDKVFYLHSSFGSTEKFEVEKDLSNGRIEFYVFYGQKGGSYTITIWRKE